MESFQHADPHMSKPTFEFEETNELQKYLLQELNEIDQAADQGRGYGREDNKRREVDTKEMRDKILYINNVMYDHPSLSLHSPLEN